MSDTAPLRAFLDLVLGDRNPISAPGHHAEVPATIARRWRGWGLAAEVDEFDVAGTTGRNVLVAPADPARPAVVVLAHHDTVPGSPGADDNGSGMAVVDALARRLAAGCPWNLALALTDFEEGHPARWPARSGDTAVVGDAGSLERFVAEHGEPPLGFFGARRLRERMGAWMTEVVLDFETVGYTGAGQRIPAEVPVAGPLPGNFVAIVGNHAAAAWVDRLASAAALPTFPLIVPGRGHDIPDARRSDHAVFWDDDDAAVLLTDTAELRNPHYHTPHDTEVDLDFLAGVVTMAGAALTAWEQGR